MSRNKEINGERNKSGQFVVGHTGLGGRPRGSRDRLGQAFVEDVYQKWRSCGTAVLDAVIRDKPHEFLKICASLMPKELHAELDMSLSVIAEARSFDEAFQFCDGRGIFVALVRQMRSAAWYHLEIGSGARPGDRCALETSRQDFPVPQLPYAKILKWDPRFLPFFVC